jgi:uncharacterized membrane protein YbhN (UPF0104 family)
MTFQRLVPWIMLAISAVIVVLLARALRQYDPAEIWQAVRGASAARLGLAIAFAAASYLCLTLFDTLALRYVGKRLPYRQIALASFTSLSIGHNVGVAALSSGAIRYRFYSRWGLSGEEVGKLIGFCAITVALGLAALGGAAALLRPQLTAEVTGLGAAAVLAIGAACIAAVAGWLVLAVVRRRPIRVWKWCVAVPPPRLAALQIAVGTVNFGFVAATLHQVLLTAAEAGYLQVAAVYVIGNVAALVSHVPGGLGVIESVVMYLLPAANLIGAVILFRFVYFLLPLPLGGLSFLATELYYRGRGAAARSEKKPRFA